jgi:hypothetical protein
MIQGDAECGVSLGTYCKAGTFHTVWHHEPGILQSMFKEFYKFHSRIIINIYALFVQSQAEGQVQGRPVLSSRISNDECQMQHRFLE